MSRWYGTVRFFFNDTATTEIYTLSLHDALPICVRDPHGRIRELTRTRCGGDHVSSQGERRCTIGEFVPATVKTRNAEDRKSTRLNSSHANISYAAFCLKKTQPTL